MSLIPIPRPFHDTLLEYLKKISNEAVGADEISRILDLIKSTKIPRKHDEIIKALRDALQINYGRFYDERELAVAHILEQKAECERKAQEGVNLNELETETRKLLSLLEDRQPGLATWNDAMRDSLKIIRTLSEKAFG